MSNKNKGGRPTDYKTEYAEQAYKLCLLAATDADLAQFFEVSEQTINAWKQVHPKFLESLKRGKAVADAEVADRLYRRAMGYEHPDLYITQYQGKIVQSEITKYYPPDTTAAIFWLKNRQPDKWRDRQIHELTGKDGQPIKHEVEINDEQYSQIVRREASRYQEGGQGQPA